MKSLVQQFKIHGEREGNIFDAVYSQASVVYHLALPGQFYWEFTP